MRYFIIPVILATVLVAMLTSGCSTRRATPATSERNVETVALAPREVEVVGAGAVTSAGFQRTAQATVTNLTELVTPDEDMALVLMQFGSRDAGNVDRVRELEDQQQQLVQEVGQATASGDYQQIIALAAKLAANKAELARTAPENSDDASGQFFAVMKGTDANKQMGEAIKEAGLTRRTVATDRANAHENASMRFTENPPTPDMLNTQIELERIRSERQKLEAEIENEQLKQELEVLRAGPTTGNSAPSRPTEQPPETSTGSQGSPASTTGAPSEDFSSGTNALQSVQYYADRAQLMGLTEIEFYNYDKTLKGGVAVFHPDAAALLETDPGIYPPGHAGVYIRDVTGSVNFSMVKYPGKLWGGRKVAEGVYLFPNKSIDSERTLGMVPHNRSTNSRGETLFHTNSVEIGTPGIQWDDRGRFSTTFQDFGSGKFVP